MSQSLIRKYIQIYMKRNAYVAFFCAAVCFVPLFIVSFLYDVISYNLLGSFVPFLIAFFLLACSYMYMFRFRAMIRHQEGCLSVVSNDSSASNFPGTMINLSEEWLIFAGSAAFHRNYIQSISSKTVRGRVGSSNMVTFTTVDRRRVKVCFFLPPIFKKSGNGNENNRQ